MPMLTEDILLEAYFIHLSHSSVPIHRRVVNTKAPNYPRIVRKDKEVTLKSTTNPEISFSQCIEWLLQQRFFFFSIRDENKVNWYVTLIHTKLLGQKKKTSQIWLCSNRRLFPKLLTIWLFIRIKWLILKTVRYLMKSPCPPEDKNRYKGTGRLNFFSPNFIAKVLECFK